MSLLDIAKLPTKENSAIRLHPTDNVAIARVPLSPGSHIIVGGQEIEVLDAVPAGHKVCLAPIQSGQHVQRYGQAIGVAKSDIGVGRH
ncbi:UxaA family hydrolase, partial [Nostoc sp. NIES-2111]